MSSSKSSKGPYLDFFPESQIQLTREVLNHPKLIVKLANEQVDIQNYGELVSFVAAEFNIIMNGEYSRLDINTLADRLTLKLQAYRRQIILPPSLTLH